MHPQLASLATRHGGTFSREDALAAGYTAAEIRSRLESGAWLRLRRGRYVSAELAETTTDPLARYRLDCWAALAVLDSAVAVSHRSAALLHGLDLHPTSRQRALALVELILPAGHSRRRPGVLGHDLPLVAAEVTHVDRLPVTSEARTGVDVAAVESLANATIALDSLLRRWAADGVERQEAHLRLTTAADRWPRKHHRRIHRAIEFADGRAESPGESLSRVLLAGQGLPPPDLQYIVAGYRSDFAWPGARTLGEFDGRMKYTEPGVLWAEKLREDALRAAGWEVARWTWDQITTNPAAVAQRLFAAFRRGSRHAG